ncbi:MAG: phage late control D family protein [Pseudomonadota bacterium]
MSFFAQTIAGLPATGFYAPDFLVEVNGAELDPHASSDPNAASKGDVLSIKVTMALDELTSAEIQLNNWDDKAVWFKYSDRPSPYPGDTVLVKLGYAGALRALLHGELKSLAPSFPATGSPTLRLGVLDFMDRLKHSRPGEDAVRQFANKQYSEIARAVGERHGLTVEAVDDGIVHAETLQGNLDDAQFLQVLARRAGYVCYMHTSPDSGEPVLRFAPPSDGEQAPVASEHACTWGESLISFEPTLTMGNQVSQVTVRGWNLDTMEEIVGTATAADLGGGSGSSGPDNAASNRQDIVILSDVRSMEEANALALAQLRNRADSYITARGEVIGTPELRPGDTMQIDGLGTRFSGNYFVTGVEHTLGSEGFRTRFDARRTREGTAA